MKLATVGVGLAADLGSAHAASVVVLVAVRQNQEELLPHRICLLAAGAEETRRLELAKAVYHDGIQTRKARRALRARLGGAWLRRITPAESLGLRGRVRRFAALGKVGRLSLQPPPENLFPRGNRSAAVQQALPLLPLLFRVSLLRAAPTIARASRQSGRWRGARRERAAPRGSRSFPPLPRAAGAYQSAGDSPRSLVDAHGSSEPSHGESSFVSESAQIHPEVSELSL